MTTILLRYLFDVSSVTANHHLGHQFLLLIVLPGGFAGDKRDIRFSKCPVHRSLFHQMLPSAPSVYLPELSRWLHLIVIDVGDDKGDGNNDGGNNNSNSVDDDGNNNNNGDANNSDHNGHNKDNNNHYYYDNNLKT